MNGDQQHQPAPAAEDNPWHYTAAPPSQYSAPLADPQQPTPQPPQHEVAWTASEFIAHEKNTLWYVALGLVTLIVLALVYIITHDILSLIVVAGLAILFGVSAARQPRTLQYRLDQNGITIDQKFYPYNDFRSFSVMQEGAFSSLSLLPLKRFMPVISIYYDRKDETAITAVISTHLPFEQHANDFVDRMARRIRF